MRTIRRRFTNAVLCFSLLALILMSTPAYAIMGVGDITFDPTNYAQITQIYNQGKQAWDTAKKSLDTMLKIQSTISEAKEGVEALHNVDLQKAANDLKSGNFSGSTDKLAALRAAMSGVEGQIGGNADYMKYQMQRIQNLETLAKLESEAAKNLSKSSTKTGVDASTKITAQSTATLATLAAAERQRNVEQDMAAAAAAEQRRKLTSDSATIYDAIGKGKR